MATPYLRYANQSATRNMPLSNRLTDALGYLQDLGITAEVFSGGQPAEGPKRVGSHRHDHGNAADVFFYKDGRKLDWANPQDRPIFEEIVRRGRAAGITGFGAGEGYMRPGSMHIGFGAPAVWGAGGSGANAPDWLRAAYGGGSAPTQVASAPAPTSPAGGARAAAEIQPMGLPAPETGPSGGILAGLTGGTPIPTDVAAYAASEDPKGIGDSLTKAAKLLDAFTPDPPRLGPMGDARSSGDALLKFINSMPGYGRRRSA